ncbi:MAG: TrkH family potassium uptake protein [Ruminococcaceae bacterium]|nr:TrkH family potassium uptake protein [Oscillospiraceae bacterium]
MNYRIILKIVGRVAGIEAVFMLLPTAVALHYRESVKGFLISIGIAVALLLVSALFTRKGENRFYAKEGFTSVALSWLVISLIGAVPFVIEGAIPNFANAFFETVSGFTTTGSTIIKDIEVLGRGILFWRSLTHWIGGMGILVFMMAVVPMSEEYSMYIMRAEVPGLEAGKLTAKIQHSSLILYVIYIFITLAEVIALIICKLPVYDAVVHAFGTAGTGGFSIKNASVGAYGSPAVETVIAVFMMLFGINFNLYFFLILGKFKSVFKNEELRCYLGIIAFATLTIALNIKHIYGNFSDALRHAFFQVNSFASTTGFATADFDRWPTYSKMMMFLLMLMGACACSTAGGLKMSRIMILIKTVVVEIKHMLHPHSFNPVRLENKTVSKEILRGTLVYFSIVIIAVSLGSLLISLEGHDLVTTVSSVATCISNVGPGFSDVGPTCNFSFFSAPSKILLSMYMLMGRLEMFPIIILLYPSTWKKKGQF